ncbi:hypothetical protein OHR68_31095 [Spirillospora sp. NBC_00431]
MRLPSSSRVIPIVAIAVAIAAVVAAILVPRAFRDGFEASPGGPMSPRGGVLVTDNPHAETVGDTIPTEVRIGDEEPVLFVWKSRGPQSDYNLDVAWRNTRTGSVRSILPEIRRKSIAALPRDPLIVGETTQKRLLTIGTPGFNGMQQLYAGDGKVFEFGAFTGAANKISCEAGGHRQDARYTRWSENPKVTIFWMLRRGDPAPEELPVNADDYRKIPDSEYPMYTAYGHNGSRIASQRLKNPPTELKGG